MATSRGKQLDPTGSGRVAADLPPLPDSIATDPQAGWLDPREWFPNPGRPFELEIGSGKGTFLAQQAALQPDTNFLGIEYAHEYWIYAADRIRRHDFDNVVMLFADAGEFLHWRVPSETVDVLHLYFPDPWPKPRHHKRRMLSDRFLEDAKRVLKPSGELRIVTDHMDYWAWMEEHFDRWCRVGQVSDLSSGEARPTPPFTRHPFASPDSAGEGEVVGTNFERKYRREGRPFNATILRKA
jgi:tRNA (guanine-N7-)-methyltransferase